MTNNIAINGRCLTRRITGVERYAHEISQHFSLPARILQPDQPLGQITGHLWEQFILPMQTHKHDVLWSPANAGPWVVSNQIVTIHDASVFDHPEWFRPSFAAWTRISWKILAKRVQAIITVSEFSSKRLQHYLKIPNHKFHIIPNGVGKPFEPQSKQSVEVVQKKYNLNKPYFLFVGTLEPRKNLTKLLDAFQQSNSSSHLLVIAGGKGKVFAESTNRVGNSNRTFFLGYVPDSDLPTLYSGASAALTISLYEGSGLTALEAMACGAPVIASNTTSFPEVTEEAALLINPSRTEDIASAITKLIENPNLANTLRERGLKRAAQFTWDESARRTQALLESI